MKNKYYIYSCTAIRSDKTKIIRIIKIQSHYQIDDLAIALVTTSDSPGFIKNIEVSNNESNYIIDDYENQIYDEGLTFNDLDDTNIRICINYNDNTKIDYECILVGEELTIKPITRTTPILLAAMGMSRFSHDEYLINHKKEVEKLNIPYINPNYDGYYSLENFETNSIMNELKRAFNYYKDIYHA